MLVLLDHAATNSRRALARVFVVCADQGRAERTLRYMLLHCAYRASLGTATLAAVDITAAVLTAAATIVITLASPLLLSLPLPSPLLP